MARNAEKVRIVPADARDRDTVRRLSAEAFARFGDYDRILPGWMELPWVRTVLAVADDRAVGFAMVAPDEAAPEGLDLLAIAVTESWKGRGLGRRLLRWVEAQDGTHVRASVAIDNHAARRLFAAAGYQLLPAEPGCYPRGQPSISYIKNLGHI